jgi:S-formylglutathione hydrolase FrmB
VLDRIRSLRLPGREGGAGQGTLLLLLPGIASLPEEFIEAGFVAALAQQLPGAEVRLLDSHFGYYEDRSILQRLRAEQIEPARREGAARIWLVGISLGGLGALGLLTEPTAGPGLAARVDGVLALAPYLGTAGLWREIERAGGPAAWAASPASQAPEPGQPRPALDRRIWHHLATRGDGPPVHLAYGEGDRFAPGHRLLAPLLPPSQVATRPGGHDWPVWSALWTDWLARHGALLRAAA